MTAAPRKHLFVDDRWIARTHAVHRRIGRPDKRPENPVVKADRPWETHVGCYGTVLDDGGRYRMWYEAFNLRADEEPRFQTAVAYAESDDGVHWHKPPVGAEHPRHGATNLVLLSSGRTYLFSPAVIRDDGEPDPERRYKMLFWDAMAADDLERVGTPFPATAAVPGWQPVAGEGMFVAFSADGVTWRRHGPQPVLGGPCDATAMNQGEDGHAMAAFKTSLRADRHFRVVAESESADFVSWSEPRVVLEPDWSDPPGTEFYGMSPFDYFGTRLGLLWLYHNAPDDKSMDIQLAAATGTNRNRHWHRAADRRTLLGTGPRGAWDAGGIMMSSRPVVAPRTDPEGIWLYYDAMNVRHDDTRYWQRAVGMARLRLDGFAAMEASYFAGELLTVPVHANGPRLMVNLAARHGRLTVDALDPASGARLAESAPLEGTDAVAVEVPWRDGRPPPADRPVALEFRLREAALYAFWFDD